MANIAILHGPDTGYSPLPSWNKPAGHHTGKGCQRKKASPSYTLSSGNRSAVTISHIPSFPYFIKNTATLTVCDSRNMTATIADQRADRIKITGTATKHSSGDRRIPGRIKSGNQNRKNNEETDSRPHSKALTDSLGSPHRREGGPKQKRAFQQTELRKIIIKSSRRNPRKNRSGMISLSVLFIVPKWPYDLTIHI